MELLTLGTGCGHHIKPLLHLLYFAASPTHLHAGPGPSPTAHLRQSHTLPSYLLPSPCELRLFASYFSACWLLLLLLPGAILSSPLKMQNANQHRKGQTCSQLHRSRFALGGLPCPGMAVTHCLAMGAGLQLLPGAPLCSPTSLDGEQELSGEPARAATLITSHREK